MIYSLAMARLFVEEPPIADTIPLTTKERRLKDELELVVERGLEQFLEVGLALGELRAKRLYRMTHATFELYVKDRFGLARSSADQLIRSASTAQCLLEAGAELPAGTTESVVRPISTLPDDADLKSAVWEFVEAIAPECGPTSPLVERVCRSIKNALDGVAEDAQQDTSNERAGRHDGPRSARLPGSPSRERAFVAPLLRLSSWQGFSLELVLSHADKLESAKSLYHACDVMRERCGYVCERLAASYPELTNA
jgi:hypothetical protein